MIFCKTNFKKNAPANIKRSLTEEHLNALDGMEVDYESNKWGIISSYTIASDNETNYYITPVPEEWCSNKRQMSLFGGDTP